MECLDCCTSRTAVDDVTSSGRLKRCSQHHTSMDPDRWNAPINPYHILELRRDATSVEIVQSYRKLALWHHPGRSVTNLDDRKSRIHFFQVLAACYETLMHNESRRRYDNGLKQVEQKRLSGLGKTFSNSTHTSSDTSKSRDRFLSPTHPERYPSSATFTQNTSNRRVRDNQNGHVQKESTPGLVNSLSSKASASTGRSEDSRINPLAAAMHSSSGIKSESSGFNFFCAPKLTATLSASDLRVNSESLVGGSLVSRSSVEEPEIQFTEATVNRLFGGPLAPLHRAHNFEPFTDPFEVFERVFGSPVFPRVTLDDETIVEKRDDNNNNNNDHRNKNNVDDMALAGCSPWNHNSGWTGSAHKEPDGLTTVFMSSRIFRHRKITRKETVHVDPDTGNATSKVTVHGEDLDNLEENKNGGDESNGWIICHRKGGYESRTKNELSSTASPTSKKADPFCENFLCVYGTAMDEFYIWNRDLYGACTGCLGCAD